MIKTKNKLFLFTILILMSYQIQAQIVAYNLYQTDFSANTGWNLGSKTNKWIINSQYTCAGTLTANTPNNGGGGYLHIFSESSLPAYGGTCACYNPTSTSETIYANFTTAVNTIGFDSVTVSFDWICKGNSNNFGFVQLSNDGGQTFSTITLPRSQYNNQTSWTSIIINSTNAPLLLNNPSLLIRFGFTSGSTRDNPGFGIDNLKIKGFNTNPIFRSQVVSVTNELCSSTNSGGARVLTTGGTRPYSYQWFTSPANTSVGSNDSIVSNLAPGNYYVIATDAGGQSITRNFAIQSIYPSPTITAGANDTICLGQTSQLSASGGIYYSWQPSSAISGSAIISNPTALPTTTTDYIVTAKAPVADEIVNGNFSAGNSGFVSEYNFFTTYPGGPGTMGEGSYAITNCPGDANSSWWACNGQDHTGGAGNMFVVNGASTAGVSVWCQTVDVTPNTDYAFSTWLSTMHTQNPAKLQFSINGQLLGSVFNAVAVTCQWNQFYEIWNSQHNTIATICIVNQNTTVSGNDFALDDISFSPLCPGHDTTTVVISQPQAFAGNDTTSCSSSSITLTASGGVSYTWNTSPISHSQQIIVSPTGATSYTVTATDNYGCTDTDDVSVTIGSFPTVNLGNDTVLCPNASIILNATHPLATSYVWQDNSTNPTFTVSQSGLYKVRVSNNCGYVEDSINVVIQTPQNLQIDGPAQACEGNSIALSASYGFTSYNWSNFEVTQQISILTEGVYSVTVTDSAGCSYSASHNVAFNPIPTIDFTDKLICDVDNYTINGPPNMSLYNWSNGSTLSSININNSGVYYLSVTDQNNCSNNDSIRVTFGTIPNITLGNDTTFCHDDFSLILTPGNQYSGYTWSNNSTSLSITVTTAGTYSVTVSQQSGCTATASITVSITPVNPIYLGEDINLCGLPSADLNAGNNTGNYSYVWSNGANSNIITITNPDTYWVRYGTGNCIVTDTIVVFGCPEITIPNVFTPNGDGFNDRFVPDATSIANFTMIIFNRWGSPIFETNDYITGWDGKVEGKEVPDGVYYWLIRYAEKFKETDIKTQSGSVTLIR